MKIFAVALIAVTLVTPVFAQTVSERTGINATFGVAPSTANFIYEAAIIDLFNIEEGKLAVERTSGATKRFAERMIADHIETSSALKPLAMSAKIEVPVALDDMHKKMLDTLKGLNGDTFVQRYRADQIGEHNDAVSLYLRYGRGGDNANLKKWAGETLAALRNRLTMAQNLGR